VTERSSSLDALIREAEARAAERPDTVAIMVGVLKLFIASEVDPYMLSGALIEGRLDHPAAHPRGEARRGRRRSGALLRDRLHAGGII
jgi:hypothetical protein